VEGMEVGKRAVCVTFAAWLVAIIIIIITIGCPLRIVSVKISLNLDFI